MDPFLGQIMTVGFNFAPRGWSTCSGQLLPIASNTALFSLLGTTFGGDGRTTFGLPDLRGRSVVGVGHGAGLDTITWGERGGRTDVTLTNINLPAHNHLLIEGNAGVKVDVNTTVYTTNNGDVSSESDGGANGLGTSGSMPEIYRESPGTSDRIGGVVSTATISGQTANTGGQQSFNIRNPFLGMYINIALQGIYPSRS